MDDALRRDAQEPPAKANATCRDAWNAVLATGWLNALCASRSRGTLRAIQRWFSRAAKAEPTAALLLDIMRHTNSGQSIDNLQFSLARNDPRTDLHYTDILSLGESEWLTSAVMVGVAR